MVSEVGWLVYIYSPPTPSPFKSPDEWPRWKRRFQQFRLASGLSAEDQERQVCTLLYSMGGKAEDILRSTNISEDECKVYDTVLEKFDQFFKVRKNVIFDATCHKCSKKGHFSSQCFSKRGKQVADITTSDQVQDFDYLNTLGGHPSTCLCLPISINGNVLDFKVDTGAEVTAITPSTYNLISTPKLDKPLKSLRGPGRKPLSSMGMMEVRLSHEDRHCRQLVYVIQDLEQNLLGLPAIRELHILSFLQEVTFPQENIISSYPKVFSGTLQGDFHIHLKPDATPFVLHTPRNAPLRMRLKVKAELECMESLGVISKVTAPTPWCAGMVAVPKPDGSVRICVDLRPLNASVLREVHPLPTVDSILAQLSGARVFSKLDANSGFWQIPLDKESCPLTTFITLYGRFCFNKMPFGISTAPEQFQK